MSSGKRIALAGSFGFHNTGDDAILQSWLHHLSIASPETEVVVIGGDASAIKQQHRVEAIDWSDWARMIGVMPSIDLLLIGGGGLFHDYWAMSPDAFLVPPKATGPSYYISLVYLAKLFGKPCLLLGVGVGPLQTATGREYTRSAFEAADHATLRDQGSLSCLLQTGISDPRIAVTADPAFGLPISQIPLGQWQEWIGCVPRGPIFGINVRNWDIGINSDRWMNQLAEALDIILDQTGGTAVFIPFQVYPEHAYTDDPSSATQVRERMKLATRAHIINRYLQPDLAEAVIASCDLVIGMRLHSIVMALRRGIPVVALAYDPKVSQAMHEAQLSNYSFELASLGSPDFIQAVVRGLENRKSISVNIGAYAQTAFDRSQLNIQIALATLKADQVTRDSQPTPQQLWAINILKEHSRLDKKLFESRQLLEKESRAHMESAALAQRQIEAFKNTERALDQIKFSLRHPVETGYKLLRRKAGVLARRLIKRNHQRNMRAASRTRAVTIDAAANPKRKALTGRVCIVAPAFFDMEGKVAFLGGAERYLYELVGVIRDLGYQPEIYQPAKGDWTREFRDLVIRGLDTDGSISEMNRVFHKRVSQPDLTIYLAFFLAAPKCFQPSIGISHGIYWDSEVFHHTADRLHETVRNVIDCFENLHTVISVDTNTINWVRTVNSSVAEKFHYLPNFVDLTQFRPRPAEFKRATGEVVILFPRRLYGPRGFWLMKEVMPEILRRHPRAVFHIVGQAGDEGAQEFMESAMNAYAGRVRWDTLAPDQMHKAYWAADISIIPTLSAEGTSLSCLEAMASGNAVIATDVGGLPNLIFHRYNGLLIRPTASDLFEALDVLIRDSDLRDRLGKRALETAQVFSLVNWKAKWLQILGAHLAKQPGALLSRDAVS